MSDLHTFDASSRDEVAKRSAEFIKRCDIILQSIFRKNYDVRQAFAAWITPLFQESENPVWLLHEHPLLIVAEYLGMDTTTIERNGPLADEYARLAHKFNW